MTSKPLRKYLCMLVQAWCNLQVKLCDPCLSALEVVTTMRYTNRRILYFTLLYYRTRGDMIKVYKMIHNECVIAFMDNRARGNSLKLRGLL